jgi:hypothetical protein
LGLLSGIRATTSVRVWPAVCVVNVVVKAPPASAAAAATMKSRP